MELFFISFGALFSVINPLGTLPIFIGLTQEKEKKVTIETAIRTALNMLIILLIAFFSVNICFPFSELVFNH